MSFFSSTLDTKSTVREDNIPLTEKYDFSLDTLSSELQVVKGPGLASDDSDK